MYISTLNMIMKIRGLNQSAISKMSDLSRQAVSFWFSSETDFQNIQILHLIELSKSLNIRIDDLTKPMPVINDQNKQEALYAEFCWDYLYPDIESFFFALTESKHPAIARLVECRGLYESAYILGNIVWKKYHLYCRYIHPARRRECTHIWEIHQNRILN